MFLSAILLLGFGVAMASITDGSSEQDTDLNSEEMPEHQDVEYALDVSQSSQSASADLYIEMEGTQSDVSGFHGRGNFDEARSIDVITLDITSADSTDSTLPLADFNSNPNMPILRLDEFDYINIDLDPDDGRIEVLRADYFERSDSNDGSESESVHAGVNFYFVPNGEQFPRDYAWSRDGAALNNEQSSIINNSDFGGIRLILRVDTGFLYNASSYEEGLNFSEEMFRRLEGVIIGNESVHLL